MGCENGRWTVRFPETQGVTDPFEIAPRSLSLRMGRNDLDYCSAYFSHEVAEAMREHTRYVTGELFYPQPAEVLLDGELVRRLYFNANYVEYGADGVFVELHDLQYSLDSGVVDKKWTSVSLREAYTEVFERRDIDIIEEIKFTVPEEIPTGENVVTTLIGEGDPVLGNADNALLPTGLHEAMDGTETRDFIDSYYAVDFKDISPAKAIWKLNEMFGVQTWVDDDFTLWVGIPEAGAVRHIAAPDDPRVWRYRTGDATIRHPRDPIFAVIVKGNWVDQPGIGTPDDIISWFNPKDEDGFGDVRAEGVAFIPDVNPKRSKTLIYEDVSAKRDALPHIAHRLLYEQLRSQHAGTVELSPELSGDAVTDIRDIAVGDVLHLVPDDRFFENPSAFSGGLGDEPDFEKYPCMTNFVHNDIYWVDGVTHSVTGDDWTVEVDVGMYPDIEIHKFTRYFDPRSEEYVSEDDVFGSVDSFVEKYLLNFEDF